jgi:hypothetical protein
MRNLKRRAYSIGILDQSGKGCRPLSRLDCT